MAKQFHYTVNDVKIATPDNAGTYVVLLDNTLEKRAFWDGLRWTNKKGRPVEDVTHWLERIELDGAGASVYFAASCCSFGIPEVSKHTINEVGRALYRELIRNGVEGEQLTRALDALPEGAKMPTTLGDVIDLLGEVEATAKSEHAALMKFRTLSTHPLLYSPAARVTCVRGHGEVREGDEPVTMGELIHSLRTFEAKNDAQREVLNKVNTLLADHHAADARYKIVLTKDEPDDEPDVVTLKRLIDGISVKALNMDERARIIQAVLDKFDTVNTPISITELTSTAKQVTDWGTAKQRHDFLELVREPLGLESYCISYGKDKGVLKMPEPSPEAKSEWAEAFDNTKHAHDIARLWALVCNEMARQDAKFGPNRSQGALIWHAILQEEIGEVSRAVVEHHFAETSEEVEQQAQFISEELVQVAAVCLQWLKDIYS